MTAPAPAAADGPPPLSALELDRRAYRRRRSQRSVLVAVASTVVFGAVVWLTVIQTPGWSAVQEAFFNPRIAIRESPHRKG